MKKNNPLFRKTTPSITTIDAEIIDDDGVDEGAELMETFPGNVKPLSIREKKRLGELEDVVTRNFKAFYEVGTALREIKTNMLYRETHRLFADYARDLWDLARRTADQYIEAVDIIDNLIPYMEQDESWRNCAKNEIPIPQNEAQARALAKYSAVQQVEIWGEAVKTADGRITAAHIKQTARQLHGKAVKKTTTTARTRSNSPTVKMSGRFRAAFNEMLSAIEEERLNDWRETSPEEAARHLRTLVEAIEAPL